MAENYSNKRTSSSHHHDVFSTSTELPRHGPCFWFFRAVKWIPVLFIVAIIAWSYYAYVVQLCFFSVQTTIEQVVFLLFYHIVFAMFVWSYWQTVFTAVGRVPTKFRIPASEMERLTQADNPSAQKRVLEIFAKDLPISNRTMNGSLRYCDKCMVIKPDRAHHCSVCGMCVLKMDHHCPWVNNCVNFTNYKYFVLFLGYGLLYCIYVAATVMRYFILFWEDKLEGGVGRFHILFLFFVAAMFAISLVSLFGYHIYLVALNRTTLEAFRTPIFRIGGPDKNGFNLGRYNNIQEVFGDDRRLWLLPIFTSFGDGLQYPVQIKHFPGNIGHTSNHNYESMGNSYSLNKFDATQTNNETNDSRKMLLLNQNNAGYREAAANATTTITTTTTTVTSTQLNTPNQEPVNNHIDRQLPPLPADGGQLTIENETNR